MTTIEAVRPAQAAKAEVQPTALPTGPIIDLRAPVQNTLPETAPVLPNIDIRTPHMAPTTEVENNPALTGKPEIHRVFTAMERKPVDARGLKITYTEGGDAHNDGVDA